MSTHNAHHIQPIRVRALVLLALTAAAALLTPAAPAAASTTDARVVIETQVDMATTTRPVGTFEVTAGADVLGCSSGSFADDNGEGLGLEHPLPTPESTYLVERRRVMTCDSGPMTGALIVHLAFGEDLWSVASRTGRWEIVGGRGDYTEVTGAGDFSLVFEPPAAVGETFTGTIDMPRPPELAITGARTAMTALLGMTMTLVGAALIAVAAWTRSAVSSREWAHTSRASAPVDPVGADRRVAPAVRPSRRTR